MKAGAKSESSLYGDPNDQRGGKYFKICCWICSICLTRQCLKREHNSEWKEKAKCRSDLEVRRK